MSYSKYLFLSSLVCFSLLQQPKLLSDFNVYVYGEDGNTPDVFAFADCLDSGVSAIYASPGTSDIGFLGSSDCGTIYILSANGGAVDFYLNGTLPYVLPTATPNYNFGLGFDNNTSVLNTAFNIYLSSDSNYELGAQITLYNATSSDSIGVNIINLGSPDNNSIVTLSNPNNDFASSNIYIYPNAILQLNTDSSGNTEDALYGGLIYFNGGGLSIPGGGTFSGVLENLNTTGSGTIFGGDQSAPLIFTGTWGNINGTTTGGLYGYMNVTTGEIQSDGANFYVNSGAQLGLTVPGTSSGGSLWSPLGIVMNGGTVQFLSAFGDETLLNNIGLLVSDSQFDINGLNITLGGALTGNGYTLNFINSSSTDGSMTLGSNITGTENIGFTIDSGVTLYTNFSGTSSSPIYLNGGALVVQNITYGGATSISSGTIDTVGNESIEISDLTGSGPLNIINSDTASSGILHISGGSYTGDLTIGSTDTSEGSIYCYVTPTLSSMSISINPTGTFQANSSVDNTITLNGGTLAFASSSLSLSDVVLGSEGGALDVYDTTATITGISGSGTLNVVNDAPETSSTLNVNASGATIGNVSIGPYGYNITFNVELPLTVSSITSSSVGTLSLNNQLTIGASSTFNGPISGTGTIVAETGVELTFNDLESLSELSVSGSSGTVTVNNQTGSTSGVTISTINIPTGTNFGIIGDGLTIETFGSGTGTLMLGADLVVTETTDSSFSGTIEDFSSTSTGVLVCQVGLGTFTLTGDNSSFTGGVEFTSGTVSISSIENLGSGTLIGNGGTLTNSGSTVITTSNPWTFLAVANESSMTFTNGFTLTGPITVSSSGDATVAGINNENGGLTLTPSSLTINNQVTFATNGINITTGTISAVGTGCGVSLGATDTTDTLTISSAEASTYSGSISNTETGNNAIGAVVIAAPVTFSGINTFTGGLTLALSSSGGTSALSISSANNLGASGAVETINFHGGALSVQSVIASSFPEISTSNLLSFQAGITTTFNIGTENGVSLILSLSGDSAIVNGSSTNIALIGGGTLEITGHTFTASEETYNVSVSGKGSALVVNSTSPTVSSASPFLNDGVLWGREESFFALADASYANFGVTKVSSLPPAVINVVVEDGAFLTGLGEVTTLDLKSGGSLIPGAGATLGVFTVTDSTVFESGSNYLIRTNGSASSFLDVGGEADVGSNVPVLLLPRAGNYTSTRHSILTAGNLSGRFQEATSPASFFLGLGLDYSSSNEVILAITPRTTVELARGVNAISVGNAIDAAVAWNRENVSYDLFSLLDVHSAIPFLGELLATLVPFTTVEEMTVALNQLQPAFFKGFTIVQESNISKVQDTLDLRMKYVLDSNSCYTFIDEKNTCCNKDEKPIHTWISGMGDVLAQESDTFAGSSQVGYQSKMGGFTAGVDGHFKAFYLGALGGYTTSYIKWRGHQGTGNINTGYAGLYLSAIGDVFYGNLSLIGGFSDFSGRRHIKYPGVDLTAKGNHAGKQLLSHADTGINWVTCGFTIRPFDAFDYITQTETGYIEQGVGEWGLTLNKTNAILLKNELGLEVSTCLCFSNMKWVIAPKASWIREVRVKGDSYTASFTTVALANAPFTVTGYFPDRSLFSPGVSLTGSMCQDRLSVELSYKGEFTHGYSDHSYAGEVRYGF